jgi:hypothetical protein
MNNFIIIKKFMTLLSLCVFFIFNANATTANCNNGECEFNNSNHYKSGTTYCLQTLNYEEVETDILHFIIEKTGEKCTIINSSNEN